MSGCTKDRELFAMGSGFVSLSVIPQLNQIIPEYSNKTRGLVLFFPLGVPGSEIGNFYCLAYPVVNIRSLFSLACSL